MYYEICQWLTSKSNIFWNPPGVAWCKLVVANFINLAAKVVAFGQGDTKQNGTVSYHMYKTPSGSLVHSTPEIAASFYFIQTSTIFPPVHCRHPNPRHFPHLHLRIVRQKQYRSWRNPSLLQNLKILLEISQRKSPQLDSCTIKFVKLLKPPASPQVKN